MIGTKRRNIGFLNLNAFSFFSPGIRKMFASARDWAGGYSHAPGVGNMRISSRDWAEPRRFVLLKLTAICYHDRLRSFSAITADCFNPLDNVHSFRHGAEDDVLPVQPRRFGRAKEKLASVGVRSSVRHGQNSRASVLKDKVLIWEFVSVDRFAPSSVASREIATLAHEARDDAVKFGSLESEPLFARAESAEILASLGNGTVFEFHDDATDRLSVDGHVEVNLDRHYAAAAIACNRERESGVTSK